MTVIENINVEDEKKIEQLKERLYNDMKPNLYENDYTFYRFLKARNFNVDQAEAMLRKHVQWRKTTQVDTILHQQIVPKALERFFLQIKIGINKEHLPTRYFAVGNIDFKGGQMSIKFPERMKVVMKIFEEDIADLDKESQKLGKHLSGCSYIVDMENFSFANATDKTNIEDAIAVLKILQDNYPERLHSLIFINASTYFNIAFAMLKGFMPPSVLNKIRIFGSPDEWKPVLRELIDLEVLPEFLGGKNKLPNEYPYCEEFVKYKGIIPSHFHICKSARSLAKSKDAKKLTIPRAAFNEIKLEVKEAGSIIEWEFETKTRDIGFGLFFSEEGSDGQEKITELVALMRLDTEQFSETGMYKCAKPGTYVMLFDNSYSWVRSKEVYYKVSVLTDKDHQKRMASS